MVENHRHNGTDSYQIEFTDLSIHPEDVITVPTGGAVVDIEARAAINQIITALKNKRLTK